MKRSFSALVLLGMAPTCLPSHLAHAWLHTQLPTLHSIWFIPNLVPVSVNSPQHTHVLLPARYRNTQWFLQNLAGIPTLDSVTWYCHLQSSCPRTMQLRFCFVTKKSHQVLSKSVTLYLAALIADRGHTHPMGCRLDSSESLHKTHAHIEQRGATALLPISTNKLPTWENTTLKKKKGENTSLNMFLWCEKQQPGSKTNSKKKTKSAQSNRRWRQRGHPQSVCFCFCWFSTTTRLSLPWKGLAFSGCTGSHRPQ